MAHSENSGSDHSHHIIPKSLLFKVFGALVFLTVLTALTAEYVNIGPLNVPLALAIAGTKASLVVMFFMALKYDKKVNTLVFSIGTVFVGVFLVFTLFDTAFRGYLGNMSAETISAQERREEELRQQDPGSAGLRIAPADFASDTTAADTTADEADMQEDEKAPAAGAPGESPGEAGH